jgi:hypothetical protein
VSLTPLDLISAHPWQRVAFTTYALSLSFFEAVILDALMRGRGSSQPLILADVHGVRGSLSEQGAHRVGKDYEVEPVVVTGGVFHPKISVMASVDECHLLVGSGNLTFNGWGGNCELLEHLHAAFAPDAISDAADFFELLPAVDRVRHGAADQCLAIAGSLRRAARGRPHKGEIRLLHSLKTSMADQMAQAAEDLGGALRLVVAAPFWDSGAAIDGLCETLGVDQVFLHAHSKGCVEGTAGVNWPRAARTLVHAVRLAPLDVPDEASRPLHAKVFEILCRRGRVLVSGSANGSGFALGPDGNIEVCIARLQRERSTGWTYAAADVPDPQARINDSDEEDQGRSGVLRGVLNGDELSGQVLTPKISGEASIYHLAAIGPELLAVTNIARDGAFSITAPDLEKWSWRGGRLVVRVRDVAGRQAEGFVSVASFAEIARRGGAVARQLFTVIFGNETPQDVAAILNWFHDDPQRLAPPDQNAISHGGQSDRDDDSERLVPVAALSGTYTEAFAAAKSSEAGHRNWSRFLDQILAAFREARGPFVGTGGAASGDDENEDDEASSDQNKTKGKDPAIDEAYASFKRLFTMLTKDGGPQRNAVIAFELTGYICARLRPDPGLAQTWLEGVLRALMHVGVPPDRRDAIAAAVLTILGMAPDPGRYRWARGYLLHLGVDLLGQPPPNDGVRNYQTVMLQQETFDSLWTQLRVIRTFQEQVDCYVEALQTGKPTPDRYSDLAVQSHEEWPTLEAAVTSTEARARLLFTTGAGEVCPVHRIGLPQGEIYKLQRTGIAITKNCCRKVLVRQAS